VKANKESRGYGLIGYRLIREGLIIRGQEEGFKQFMIPISPLRPMQISSVLT